MCHLKKHKVIEINQTHPCNSDNINFAIDNHNFNSEKLINLEKVKSFQESNVEKMILVNSINNSNYNDNIPINNSTLTNDFLVSQKDFMYLDFLSDLISKIQFIRLIEEIETKCFSSSDQSDKNYCERFLDVYKIVSECIYNCSIMNVLYQKVFYENILNLIKILFQHHSLERLSEN